MKEFVKIILENFLAWLCIGGAIGVAVFIYLSSRSTGKIIGIIVVGFLLAYCCWNLETVMNKFNELVDLAARFIKFAG